MTGVEPKERALLKGHTALIGALSFSHDGKTLASGSNDQTARVWDLSGPEPKQRAVLPSVRKQVVWAVALAPDGHTLAYCGPTGGEDNQSLKVFDLSGAEPKDLGTYFSGWSFAFSPDGKTLAVGTGGVHLWDVGSKLKLRAEIYASLGHVAALAFSPDGSSIVFAASRDWVLRQWDLTGPEPKDRSPVPGPIGEVRSLAFAAGTPLLVSSDYGGIVRSWEFGQPPLPP